MENSRRRVVITGMGVMTALGETVQDYWDGLINGRSGIGPMTLCDPTGYPCKIAGEVRTFDPSTYMEPKEARRMSRFSQLAVAAAVRAQDALTYPRDLRRSSGSATHRGRRSARPE